MSSIKQILFIDYLSNGKKVIKSLLVLKLYTIVDGFNIRAVFKSTTEEMLNIKVLLIIVYTNCKS